MLEIRHKGRAFFILRFCPSPYKNGKRKTNAKAKNGGFVIKKREIAGRLDYDYGINGINRKRYKLKALSEKRTERADGKRKAQESRQRCFCGNLLFFSFDENRLKI